MNQQPFDRLTKTRSQALSWSIFYAIVSRTGQWNVTFFRGSHTTEEQFFGERLLRISTAFLTQYHVIQNSPGAYATLEEWGSGA